jgi:hypothetical protein
VAKFFRSFLSSLWPSSPGLSRNEVCGQAILVFLAQSVTQLFRSFSSWSLWPSYSGLSCPVCDPAVQVLFIIKSVAKLFRSFLSSQWPSCSGPFHYEVCGQAILVFLVQSVSLWPSCSGQSYDSSLKNLFHNLFEQSEDQLFRLFYDVAIESPAVNSFVFNR